MKALFVDTWTKGIHNFLPIAAELRRHGMDSLLVHRGSWGADPSRPVEETISGLLVRDIRYYGTRLIHKVLKQEQPDVVLILNSDMISDRAIILAARALGIRTAYTMHGVQAVGDQREADMRGYADKLRSSRFAKIWKYLHLTLPDYFRSGIASSWWFPLRATPYMLILRTFLRPERYVHYPPPSKELQCDVALMWGHGYEPLVRDLGYPNERIRIVGHPPLDPVFRFRDQIAREAQTTAKPSQQKPIVLFLEGALVEGGYEGWTDESRIRLIDEMADASRRVGRRLVVKLHPGTRGDSIFANAKTHDRWSVLRDVSLVAAVHQAESVISHSSTSVTVAIALEKPILIPRWGISAAVPDYYAAGGVATGCLCLADLESALAAPSMTLEDTKIARMKFTQEFLGPTDGRAIERIAGSLLELARSRRGNRVA